MNISFANTVLCDPQGNEYFFEHLFVHARNIRYVHIPETVSICVTVGSNIIYLVQKCSYINHFCFVQMSVLTTIKNEFVKSKREPVQKPGEKSRKVKKALQQHMRTVASLPS